MSPSCRGVSMQERLRRVLRGNERPPRPHAVAPSGLREPRGLLFLAPKRSTGWLFSLICMLALAIPQTPSHAAQAHPNRMQVDYVPPTNPAHQALYERLRSGVHLRSCRKSSAPFARRSIDA